MATLGGNSFLPSEKPATLLGQQFIASHPVAASPGPGRPQIAKPTAGALREAALDMIGRDSIASEGYTVASFAAETKGDHLAARRLMSRSLTLSRRDRLARYWQMEQAIRRGQIDAALTDIDVLLRSLGNPSPELFQQFVPLVGIAEGRDALIRQIRRDPNWVLAMYETLVAALPRGEPVAMLMLEANRPLPTGERARATYASLLDKLSQEGAASTLLALYPKLPSTHPELLRTVAPQAVPLPNDYAPISWYVAGGADLNANILAPDNGDRNAYLDVTAAPGHGGIAAAKLFTPGAFRALQFQAKPVDGIASGTASLTVTCLGSTNLAIHSPNLLANSETKNGVLGLPQHCPLARLDVEIHGGSTRQTAEIQISRFALR